jgi:hypothetical protein
MEFEGYKKWYSEMKREIDVLKRQHGFNRYMSHFDHTIDYLTRTLDHGLRNKEKFRDSKFNDGIVKRLDALDNYLTRLNNDWDFARVELGYVEDNNHQDNYFLELEEDNPLRFVAL